MSERIICFGQKTFNFRETNHFYEFDLFKKSTKEDWEQIIKGNPHWDILEMTVSACYDTQTKEFYNHSFGMKGNIAGDMFWGTEYTLEILRSNKVPENEIPDFILNHKDIERRFLEGDTSTYENAQKYPTYYHKMQHLFSNLPDLV